MATRVIKVHFNSHLRDYTNKKCVKYSLSEMPKPAKLKVRRNGNYA